MNTDAPDTIPADLMPFHERLAAVESKTATLVTGLAENTKLTTDVRDSVGDLLDVLAALKGAFKVLEFVGKLARPVGYIAAAGAALWGAVTVMKSGHSVTDITPKP